MRTSRRGCSASLGAELLRVWRGWKRLTRRDIQDLLILHQPLELLCVVLSCLVFLVRVCVAIREVATVPDVVPPNKFIVSRGHIHQGHIEQGGEMKKSGA